MDDAGLTTAIPWSALRALTFTGGAFLICIGVLYVLHAHCHWATPIGTGIFHANAKPSSLRRVRRPPTSSLLPNTSSSNSSPSSSDSSSTGITVDPFCN
jgi:hypothetical protein